MPESHLLTNVKEEAEEEMLPFPEMVKVREKDIKSRGSHAFNYLLISSFPVPVSLCLSSSQISFYEFLIHVLK
jgi:hypothetical protein